MAVLFSDGAFEAAASSHAIIEYWPYFLEVVLAMTEPTGGCRLVCFDCRWSLENTSSW